MQLQALPVRGQTLARPGTTTRSPLRVQCRARPTSSSSGPREVAQNRGSSSTLEASTSSFQSLIMTASVASVPFLLDVQVCVFSGKVVIPGGVSRRKYFHK